MDVHRVRYIRYPPAAINAVAFSSSTQEPHQDPTTLRLAVGRANGNIEIWNPARGTWIQEKVFSGGYGRSIEGLAWTQDPDEHDEEEDSSTVGRLRLFSHDYSNTVTEWDLCTGLPRQHASGNYSDIWCLAPQPAWQRAPVLYAKRKNNGRKELNAVTAAGQVQRSQSLVAGCADGTLVLFSTADDQIRFQKYLARPTAKKARALSVTWKDRHIVIAGFANSTIGVYDTRNNAKLRHISLGATPAGGPKEIFVWAVRCLPDGTLVSGDSLGDVRFWDATTYTQLQKVNGHEADILDLVISKDGTQVVSGGMDRRTVVYRQADASGRHKKRWIVSKHDRLHQHDIKSMAAYESKHLNVVASGGLDTNLTIAPFRDFGKEYHRIISGLPQRPPLASAPSARAVITWWGRDLRFWRIPDRQSVNTYGVSKADEVCLDPLCLKLRVDGNITCASVSEDDSLVAAADVSEIRLYRILRPGGNVGSVPVKFIRRKGDFASSYGARLLQFSKDGKWLAAVTPTNAIFVLRMPLADEANDHKKRRAVVGLTALRRLQRFKQAQNALNGEWGRYDRTITQLHFSDDSSILATADLGGHIDSWLLEGERDLQAPPAKEIWPLRSSPEESVQSSSSSGENSDDDARPGDEEEKRPRSPYMTFYRQHWIRNPASHLIPTLGSVPLLLKFRPISRHSKDLNRSTSRPHNHNISNLQTSSESRLIVITAAHQILEFDVITGSLTSWSRRNGLNVLAKALPHQVGRMRDRVMGAFWDVNTPERGSRGQQRKDESDARARWARLWMYGSTWMAMIDLEQDVPFDEPSDALENVKTIMLPNNDGKTAEQRQLVNGTHRKRKRQSNAEHEQPHSSDEEEDDARSPSQPAKKRNIDPLRLGTSGAGSKTVPRETGHKLGASVRTSTIDQDGKKQYLHESEFGKADDGDSFSGLDDGLDEEVDTRLLDDETDEEVGGLLRLRRAGVEQGESDEEDASEAEGGNTDAGTQRLVNGTSSAHADSDSDANSDNAHPQHLVNGIVSTSDDAAVTGFDAGKAHGHDPITNGTKEHKSLIKQPQKQQQRASWYTYTYRPILGIVPIAPLRNNKEASISSSPPSLEHLVNGFSDGVENNGVMASEAGCEADMDTEARVPEVVLVERPFWDLDLPPRVMGVHEREK